MVVKDKFGLLEFENSLISDFFKIEPMENYVEIIKHIKEITNLDGFIYPPTEHRIELDMTTMKQKRVIPNTDRPALLHRLPASHNIELYNPPYANDLRKWDLNLIIQLLAFIKGVQLQFYDWWFVGRIPIKSTNNFYVSPAIVNEFIIHCYDEWLQWKEHQRQWIINLLYMHARAPSYNWDWEKFMLNYMVFDGIYKLASELHKCKTVSTHKDRFYILIEKFGLVQKKEYIEQIYALRNELFHQAIWDGGLPNSSEGKYMGWAHHETLRKLNVRLITALFGFKTKFIQTPWFSIHSTVFDPQFYEKR